jgi:hypothetical protein
VSLTEKHPSHDVPGEIVSKKWSSPLIDKELEFCTLRFCPESRLELNEKTDEPVVLLAIRDARTLSFYVHWTFEATTTGLDHRYVQELLPDLVERSHSSPDVAFRQLSCLSVGPLLTDEVGVLNFSKHPVESLYPGLKPLARSAATACSEMLLK